MRSPGEAGGRSNVCSIPLRVKNRRNKKNMASRLHTDSNEHGAGLKQANSEREGEGERERESRERERERGACYDPEETLLQQ